MIKTTFDTYFAHWSILLPDESTAAQSHGDIRQTGRIIKHLFGTESERAYPGFYGSHRVTNDRHCL